ncbi:MAG TPA: nicotinate-nucleotide adenylyltransferase [Acidimicrobiales bacterium]|nr:nicotinate-nucleotide adenylyltransferase [Acidimicrobiales bacterium]
MVAKDIGVFGGTFDPIHVGHLVAAVNVRHTLALDRLLLVVANVPWQKAGSRSITPAEDRFAMVAAAVAGVPGLEASRIEIDRGGLSYTADTLAEVSSANPGANLYCVVGADAAPELATWERADEIARLATLVIVNRPGASLPGELPGWKVVEVVVPALEVSSTDLRARAADGRPLDYLVPDAAVHTIRTRGLYAEGR